MNSITSFSEVLSPYVNDIYIKVSVFYIYVSDIYINLTDIYRL